MPAEAREGALAHLATCPACRQQVELERATKARLKALSVPTMTDQLRATLVGLATRPLSSGRPTQTPPAGRSGRSGVGGGGGSPRPPLLRPAAAAFAPLGSSRWPRLALTGIVAASLGAALTVTFDAPTDSPGGGTGRIVQPGGYVQQHDATTVGLLQDPAVPVVATLTVR
jgi:anti-sigma factor RsiW